MARRRRLSFDGTSGDVILSRKGASDSWWVSFELVGTFDGCPGVNVTLIELLLAVEGVFVGNS